MDRTALEDRLARTMGLDAKSLGSTVFRQAVDRRMQARRAPSLSEYSLLLDADGGELQALVEELVVKESWFFRHLHAFELLGEHATAAIAARRGAYRALSFPCAGGEEPYSIVMCLREAGLDWPQIQVDAADISAAALEKAHEATYGLRSVRAVPRPILVRYFRVAADSVTVLSEIRKAVRFMRANIVATPPALDGASYDAVFCRNLLIYMTPSAREKVVVELDRLLAPGGLLFVGHAEMNREFAALFEPVQRRGAFAYRRRVGTSAPVAALPLPSAASQPSTLASPRSRVVTKSPSTESRMSNRQPTEAPLKAAPATTPIESASRNGAAPTHAQTSSDEAIRKASELSNALRFPEAIEICERQLRLNGPSPHVYHMLGMVLQAAGMHEPASQALERAVYLDPQHEEALLGLALLARRRGDTELADRFEQRSRRAHGRSQRS